MRIPLLQLRQLRLKLKWAESELVNGATKTAILQGYRAQIREIEDRMEGGTK